MAATSVVLGVLHPAAVPTPLAEVTAASQVHQRTTDNQMMVCKYILHTILESALIPEIIVDIYIHI